MFPMVPQGFGAPVGFAAGAARLLVPGKVTAAAPIGQGAATGAIGADSLLGRPDVVQISAHPTPQGTLDLEQNSKEIWCYDTHWVRAVRLSEDCHSYNVQLRLQKSCDVSTSKLILQAVRSIETGQELLLWFSEDVLAMMQIAFLSPANIQGQKKYVCTKCSALYESPNPLKLHISLSCGRSPVSSLWERLSQAVSDTSLRNPFRHDSFDFRLSPEPQITRQRSAMDLSLARHEQKEPSAFRPFRKATEGVVFCHTENLLTPTPPWPLSPFEAPLRRDADDEAHIETLVSSLGRSKQGHVCLYCGKCYSRKYGLKIHIRTHTGYKPLKCKYCMRPFGDPSNLNKHVRLHAEGNTPYKCDLCGKILVRRRDLDRHLKSRHMTEMHPGLDILQEDSNPDEDLKSDTN